MTGTEILGTDRIVPDTESQSIIFEPSEYLLSWFAYQFDFPVSSVFIHHPKAICQYKVRFAEQYGTPVQVHKWFYSTNFFALPGALNDDVIANFNIHNQNWWDQLQYNRTFLSNSPETKYTSRYIPEKLWFLCWFNNPSPVKLIVTLILDDGSVDEFETAPTTMKQHHVYEINVGCAALQIIDYNILNFRKFQNGNFE
jgi:hypothetical protein